MIVSRFFINHPLTVLAWRYVFSRRDRVVFWVNMVSILVVSLSVASLIASLSIINGFFEATKEKIISKTPHFMVYKPNGVSFDGGAMLELIKSQENVSWVEATKIGVIGFSRGLGGEVRRGQATVLGGIESQEFFFDFPKIDRVDNGGKGVFLDEVVAKNMGVNVGDDLVIYEHVENSPLPHMEKREVISLFKNKTGMGFEVVFNKNKEVVSLSKTNMVFGILKDPMSIGKVKSAIVETLPLGFTVKFWDDTFKGLFNALHLQKKILYFVLFVIIMLGIGNMVNSTIVFLREKKGDAALMVSLGIGRNKILWLFSLRILITVVISLLLGTILGVILSIYGNEVLVLIDSLIGLNMKGNVDSLFGLDYLPYKFQLMDFLSTYAMVIFGSIALFALPFFYLKGMEPGMVLKDDR